MAFKELGIQDFVLKNIEAMGYEEPTEIQSKAIPAILKKKDTVMQSQTGSGKTAAFGVPLIQSVLTDVPAVQFMILVPARELALQVHRELARIAEGSEVQVLAVYGGSSFSQQVDGLRKGAHIVVGTPGRILDHLKRRTMSVSVVRGVVLDEADKMLSMGFLPEMRLIFKHLPKRHQMIMSSATFPPAIEHIIASYMDEPIRLEQDQRNIAPSEIEHCYCISPLQEKDQVLLRFIEKEEPELSLIFCNTKIEVKAVTWFLNGAGINAVYLSSDLSQNQREHNLTKFRLGMVNHLVCTDVAARGIDVPNLSHVFVYSSADDLETYVHRTGRTGRAGKKGRAISLVAGTDIANFNMALKANDIKAVEIPIPSDEEIVEARVSNQKRALENINHAADADVHEEFIRLADRLTDDQAKALLPFLLEKFLRHAALIEMDENLPATKVKSESEPEGGSHRHREHRDDRSSSPRKGRRRRDRGSERGGRSDDRRRQFQTLCIAIGNKDGMSPGDIVNALKRAGDVRSDAIGRIKMGDHESLVNIDSGSVRFALKADGKHYRHHELFIAESAKALDE